MADNTWQALLSDYNLHLARSRAVTSSVFSTTSSYIAPCASYRIFRVQGKDAAQFLQGQITCDIRQLKDTKMSLGAFCDPKGRVICTFWLYLIEDDESYYLVTPEDIADRLHKRLLMYVLRSDVKIEDVSDKTFLSTLIKTSESPIIEPSESPASIFYSARMIGLPAGLEVFHFFSDENTLFSNWIHFTKRGYEPVPEGYWRQLQVLSGQPEIGESFSGEYVPQMINLDIIDGVSFNKGCYTGQEVVARLHYLGKPSRRTYLAKAITSTAIPLGSEIYAYSGGENYVCGQIISSITVADTEQAVLAVIQVEKAIQTTQFKLEDNTLITLIDQPYKID